MKMGKTAWKCEKKKRKNANETQEKSEQKLIPSHGNTKCVHIGNKEHINTKGFYTNLIV